MMLRSFLCVCLPAALLLVACEAPKTVKVEEDAAATETAAAGAADAAAKRMPLPNCDGLQPEAGDDGRPMHKDCRGAFPGDAGLMYEARFKPGADDATDVTIDIVGPGDATLQSISEQMDVTIATPEVKDIDQDGRSDLLVPLNSGNVNTNWAVWRGAADGRFVRAGELSGVDIARTKDGYIAASGRSGANMWEVEFFTIDADKFAPVATAMVEMQLTDAGGTGKVSCQIRDDGGLAKAKLSPIAAEKLFCMDPIVSDIFK